MKPKFFSFFLLTFYFSTTLIAGDIDPEMVIPINSKVKIGKLDNGLTYYIRENKKPENRAELRLVVNAGSVLESDDQQGLAHFLEHMAFNGTKNFEKQELVDYLESIGMRFGPDLNAYTIFDETVYMLQIPTDSTAIMENAFQILEDWSYQVSLEDEEIDKERGVIVEEWRLRRGAMARMRDRQYPILFHDSRYADRLPIGKMDIIENFEYETLRDFYKKWYRPDLMAVIAIGDFNSANIENLIKTHFNRVPKPEAQIERPFYPVPDHDQVLYAIATDPEATSSGITIYYKHEVAKEQQVKDYYRMLVERLYNLLLNRRFQEIVQQAEPPFLYGRSSNGSFVRTKDYYALSAAVKNEGIIEGLKTLLIEAERVKQFGFTQSELTRGQTQMLRSIERSYEERDKSESGRYASEYVRNFLTGEPIPGIEFEYEMQKKYLPLISLAEVNEVGTKFMTDNNRVIAVNAPEQEGLVTPTEDELAKVFTMVAGMEIAAYEDNVSDKSLFTKELSPKSIIAENYIKEVNVTEWNLANGIKVILKPTDFKNDEVKFTAFSPGGNSVVEDVDYVAALSATAIIHQSGIAEFDLIELQKLLTGKIARVTPYISELEEGIMGSASPRDLEIMFQLIYLNFYAPRADSTAYKSYTYRLREYLKNRHASPEAAYQDTIQTTMAQQHFRRRPWSTEMFSEMDMIKSLKIYQDRFADASDFTFIFVGNVSPDTLKPFVEKYLANLPDLDREETWVDRQLETPIGKISKKIKKGIEQQSEVQIHISGEFDWSAQNDYDFRSMVSVLKIKLRETLREDMGGTYGVGASAFTSRYPEPSYRIIISFGCDPDRVDELTKAVFNQIDSLKSEPVSELYMTKVKESQLRAREKSEKENTFWVNKLEGYYFHGWDPRDILTYKKYVNNLTSKTVLNTAQEYLNLKNQATFVLIPEVNEEN